MTFKAQSFSSIAVVCYLGLVSTDTFNAAKILQFSGGNVTKSPQHSCKLMTIKSFSGNTPRSLCAVPCMQAEKVHSLQ